MEDTEACPKENSEEKQEVPIESTDEFIVDDGLTDQMRNFISELNEDVSKKFEELRGVKLSNTAFGHKRTDDCLEEIHKVTNEVNQLKELNKENYEVCT